MIIVLDSQDRIYLVKRLSQPEQKLIFRNRLTGEIYTDLELIGEDLTPRYSEPIAPATEPVLLPALMA